MDIRTAYNEAYRHFRIQRNRDDSGWYWFTAWDTSMPDEDMPVFVDLFTSGITHLHSLAVGNAVKSIEWQQRRDIYSDNFLNRQYDIIGWARYEAIMKVIDPDYDPAPF